MTDDSRAVVATTLTFLADGWVSEADGHWMRQVVDAMEHPVDSWTCCPLCSEIVCDDHCPLHPVRDDAGLWAGSSGHPRPV